MTKRKEVVPRPEDVPAHEEPYEPPTHFEPAPKNPGGFLVPTRASLGEVLSGIVLLYACSIAAFNAGYFLALKGRFVELFTFADLVGINIPIIQYFVGVMFFYGVTSALISATVPQVRSHMKRLVETAALKLHVDSRYYFLMYFIVLGLFIMTTGLLNSLKVQSFTLIMLPSVIFQGILFAYFWIGYKFDLVAVRTVVTVTLLTLFIFSFNSGYSWLESDTRSPEGVQAIYLQDGTCMERKVLRSSSNGLLLFSYTLQAYEFRNKDSIRTIFDRKGCI